MFRLLIVEDDVERIECFKQWMPEDVRTTIAKSSGQAMGVLQRDRGDIYGGILLDHDLQEQARTDADRYLCGADVVDVLIRNISPDVPILVHSMNAARASLVVKKLEMAGFYVARIPFGALSRGKLLEWLRVAREI